MRKLIVISPCICRSDIHNVCFDVLLKMLSNVAKYVYFVVNIDPCSGTSNESQEETSANLARMFLNYGIEHEIHCSKKGCFFNASQTLLKRANALIDDQSSAILWFEDDKLMNKDPMFAQYLDDAYSDDFVIHLWKASAKCPTFHPCLWSASMAKRYLIPSILNETIPYDPELLMMRYWRQNFNKEIVVQYHKDYSIDIGRKWQQDNNVNKWVREDMKNKNVTYI